MAAIGGAVVPGTDLSRHARQLVRIHDAVLSGSRPPARPRAVVARSWGRVLGLGLAADRINARRPLPPDELERRRRHSRLSLVVDELRGVLTSVADASMFLVVVCDADGVVLWREGSTPVRMTADRLGFCEGMDWTEGVVGTNAIGTALAEAAPVELFSAEHFENRQHPWYCSAVPVHDPRDGTLLGVVDVSGPALTLHPAVGALVRSAVRLAESALWRHHHDGLEVLRRATEAVVSGCTGPLLVVDDDGWVAHHAGLAARERIEAPRAGRAVAVPGVGACLPERLTGGWLVRPAGTGTVSAVLRDGPEPLLEVGGGADGAAGWCTPLTPRHAQVLAALVAAGPGGLSARGLSMAVWGDADHVVTARAETSRLRRVVGALVTTGPYRIADGVRVEVTGSPRPASRPGVR